MLNTRTVLAHHADALCLESLRFLAVGDWGGVPVYPYDTPIETAVAKQMAHVSDMYQSSFNLALGDNFYFDGVEDVYDKRFQVRSSYVTFVSRRGC